MVSSDIPEDGEKWDEIMTDVNRAIMPGITHWESNNFYAYFKPHASYPSILGEMMAAGFNVMGFSWM
jgi:hypothetical protein